MPVHDLENPVNNEDESDKNNESQEKASENLSKVNLQVSQISIANPQINLESDNRQAFEQQLEAHKKEEEEENITGAFNVGDKVNCTNIKEFHIIIKKESSTGRQSQNLC
ncbi:unnamed protein product [Blepharisma stoltei]|uniref:Uncharacterized protein n=1 Tax=Blepharisma stoltei TaxID=1481888 RepID=A0AAU9IDF9_9CILI|nr:unnamed protein product [Blepharisma stoltei]